MSTPCYLTLMLHMFSFCLFPTFAKLSLWDTIPPNLAMAEGGKDIDEEREAEEEEKKQLQDEYAAGRTEATARVAHSNTDMGGGLCENRGILSARNPPVQQMKFIFCIQ